MGRIILELDVMMAKRHLSLNDLADKVGISNVNLSKIKNNKGRLLGRPLYNT